MKVVSASKTKNQQDSLRYAYAFMKTSVLKRKECSFVNPDVKMFDSQYAFPRDMYLATYNEANLPTWEAFRVNPKHRTPAFSCIACLDENDKQRVGLNFIGDEIIYTCYGDYDKAALAVFEQVKAEYLKLE